jgi:hypothetical protein
MIANSIPALDANGQENFGRKLAYIGHAQFFSSSTLAGPPALPAEASWAMVAETKPAGIRQ